MKITIMGCGGSGGVPLTDGFWGNCNPANPKNNRSRAAICVDGDDGTRIIVDTGPDFREQMIKLGWNNRLDAVLYTHHHADHMYGMDDLRRISIVLGHPIDIYGHEKTLAHLKECFLHVFKAGHTDFYPQMVVPHFIKDTMQFGDMTVRPFRQDHGVGMSSTGYRFNDFIYSSDIWEVPDETWEILEGAKVWVVDMGGDGNPAHADKEKIMRWSERLKIERVYVTHLTPTFDYDALCSELPENIRPCYDGMVIEL